MKENGIRYVWTGDFHPPTDMDKDIDPKTPAVTVIEDGRVVHTDHVRFMSVLKQFKALLSYTRKLKAKSINEKLADDAPRVTADSITLSRQERAQLFRDAAKTVTGKYFPHLTEYMA